jgi:hypothetical protein
MLAPLIRGAAWHIVTRLVTAAPIVEALDGAAAITYRIEIAGCLIRAVARATGVPRGIVKHVVVLVFSREKGFASLVGLSRFLAVSLCVTQQLGKLILYDEPYDAFRGEGVR